MEDIELDNLESERKTAHEKEHGSIQQYAPTTMKPITYVTINPRPSPPQQYIQPKYAFNPKQLVNYILDNHIPESTYQQSQDNNNQQYIKIPKYQYQIPQQYQQQQQAQPKFGQVKYVMYIQPEQYIPQFQQPQHQHPQLQQPQYKRPQIQYIQFPQSQLQQPQLQHPQLEVQQQQLQQPQIQQPQLQQPQFQQPQHSNYQSMLDILAPQLGHRLFLQGLTTKIPMHPIHYSNFQRPMVINPQPKQPIFIQPEFRYITIPRKQMQQQVEPKPIFIIKAEEPQQNDVYAQQPQSQNEIYSQAEAIVKTSPPKSLLDSYIPSMVQLQYMKGPHVKAPQYPVLEKPTQLPETVKYVSNHLVPAPSAKQYTYQSYFPVEHGGGSTSYVNYRLGRYAE